TGLRAAIQFLCFTGLVILILNGPFFVYDPGNFVPLALWEKLGAVPDQLHAMLLLPIISIFIASLSICAKLDEQKLLGAIAIALLLAFVIPILFEMSASQWALDSLIFGNYFLPVTVFGGISLIGCLATINRRNRPRLGRSSTISNREGLSPIEGR